MKALQIVVVLGFLSGLWVPANATHIVGGEMNYRCLGNQQYEVVLTVYRDCFNGVPFFDNPASVGVFDANGKLIHHLQIPYVADDTLKPTLTGECFVLPPNACVHTSTYRDTVSLDASPGGYTLVYQRCCRNMTILNLESPDSTGATFSIYISEDALLGCNSSPVFKEWPPIYICVNEPIEFDHSAADVEGDSIVYRLCTPLKGGTLQVPQPVPPVAPPYPEVVWRDPPYNLNNVMGGVPLAIDPSSGLLSGVPNTIGQFVVGICADEYRDDEVISSTRRDFQYNVGICGMTVAGFATPEVNCGLTVKFNNISANADSFLWYFNVENDLSATSTEFNPSYTYPDSGYYTVMMIAEPGDKCVDTFIQVIRVERLSILADFDYNFPFCEDSLTLSVIDQSTDTISQIVQWAWTLTGNGKSYTESEQFPTFFIDTSGIWILNLVVTAENGCKDTSRIIFPVQLAVLPWPDTTWRICLGDTIGLNPLPDFGPNLNYTWSPNLFLSNPKQRNPLAFPDTSIVYTLKTTSMNGICKGEKMVGVEVSPPIQLDVPPDTVICSNPFWLEATTDRPVEIIWSSDPEFSDTLTTGNPGWLTVEGDQWVYLFASDSTGCTVEDSVFVINQSMEVILPDTLVLCPPGTSSIIALFPDPSDTLVAINWTPLGLFPGGNTSNPVTFGPTLPGEYTVTAEATNQYGCTGIDSMFVAVLDTSSGPLSLTWTTCADFHVLFHLDVPGAFGYEWDFGDPAQPGIVGQGGSPEFTYSGPGTYTVTTFIDVPGGCMDTISRNVTLGMPPIDLYFSWEYQACSDTAIISLSNLSVNDSSSFLQFHWFVNGIPASDSLNAEWTVYASEQLAIRLIAISENGCVDTLDKTVVIPVIELDLDEEYQICPGDSIQLNIGGNPGYSYLWSPDSSLSASMVVSPWASPVQSTTYMVTVGYTNPDTCSFSGEVQVDVLPLPNYQIPPDTLICDSLAFLKAIVPSSVSVSWYSDPQLTNLLIQGNQILYPVYPMMDFYLLFKDQQGCTAVDSFNVQSSFLDLLLPDTLSICPGDTLELDLQIQGDTTGLMLSWSGTGEWELIPGTNRIRLFGGESYELSVSGSNSWGCVSSVSAWVWSVDQSPSLSVSATPPVIIPGQSSQLMATPFPGWSYSWVPVETLTDAGIPNPVATPDSTTTYTVYFTDDRGCSASAQVTITVATPICDDPYIFVPNTFTPNDDQVNDRLYVRGVFIDEMVFMIYDRWGNLVFSTTDQQVGWDGTYKGKDLGSDVFGYYLEARCYDGQVFTKRGNVSLIRL
ncbi:MAG: gliding motility-associated C-terminal domain-containing protein [Saprospiraceae bacterium]